MLCRNFLCGPGRDHSLPYECPLAVGCAARKDYGMAMNGKSPMAIGMRLLMQRKKVKGAGGERKDKA